MATQELSSSEKFLEKSIVVERFIKKYKNTLIATGVILVGIAIGYGVYDYKKQSEKIASNMAYLKLTKNPTDSQSLQILQDNNPHLYELFVATQAIKQNKSVTSNTQDPILSDIISYYNAKDVAALERYTLQEDALLKNLSRLQLAYELMKKGEIQKAHSTLELISEDSILKEVATTLKHYGVKQ